MRRPSRPDRRRGWPGFASHSTMPRRSGRVPAPDAGAGDKLFDPIAGRKLGQDLGLLPETSKGSVSARLCEIDELDRVRTIATTQRAPCVLDLANQSAVAGRARFARANR